MGVAVSPDPERGTRALEGDGFQDLRASSSAFPQMSHLLLEEQLVIQPYAEVLVGGSVQQLYLAQKERPIRWRKAES